MLAGAAREEYMDCTLQSCASGAVHTSLSSCCAGCTPYTSITEHKPGKAGLHLWPGLGLKALLLSCCSAAAAQRTQQPAGQPPPAWPPAAGRATASSARGWPSCRTAPAAAAHRVRFRAGTFLWSDAARSLRGDDWCRMTGAGTRTLQLKHTSCTAAGAGVRRIEAARVMLAQRASSRTHLSQAGTEQVGRQQLYELGEDRRLACALLRALPGGHHATHHPAGCVCQLALCRAGWLAFSSRSLDSWRLHPQLQASIADQWLHQQLARTEPT